MPTNEYRAMHATTTVPGPVTMSHSSRANDPVQKRDREWVGRARQGDEDAFAEIFRTYYPGLCSFAATYMGSIHNARSLVQDVFVKIWETRSNWTVHTALRPYLYRAVRNAALNQVEKNRTRREREREFGSQYASDDIIDVHSTPTDSRITITELTSSIKRGIEQLPERQRTAFVLHRQHDLSYAEIAVLMNISSRTVEVHISKALKHLRDVVR